MTRVSVLESKPADGSSTHEYTRGRRSIRVLALDLTGRSHRHLRTLTLQGAPA
jgi:hypothetical protein